MTEQWEGGKSLQEWDGGKKKPEHYLIFFNYKVPKLVCYRRSCSGQGRTVPLQNVEKHDNGKVKKFLEQNSSFCSFCNQQP
jgi:hypothetical protein